MLDSKAFALLLCASALFGTSAVRDHSRADTRAAVNMRSMVHALQARYVGKYGSSAGSFASVWDELMSITEATPGHQERAQALYNMLLQNLTRLGDTALAAHAAAQSELNANFSDLQAEFGYFSQWNSSVDQKYQAYYDCRIEYLTALNGSNSSDHQVACREEGTSRNFSKSVVFNPVDCAGNDIASCQTKVTGAKTAWENMKLDQQAVDTKEAAWKSWEAQCRLRGCEAERGSRDQIMCNVSTSWNNMCGNVSAYSAKWTKSEAEQSERKTDWRDSNYTLCFAKHFKEEMEITSAAYTQCLAGDPSFPRPDLTRGDTDPMETECPPPKFLPLTNTKVVVKRDYPEAFAEVEWFLGGFGESCANACLARNSTCNVTANDFSKVDTEDSMDSLIREFGHVCKRFIHGWWYGVVPIFQPSNGCCWMTTTPRAASTWNCSRNPHPAKRRLCRCAKSSTSWILDETCNIPPGGP